MKFLKRVDIGVETDENADLNYWYGNNEDGIGPLTWSATGKTLVNFPYVIKFKILSSTAIQ